MNARLVGAVILREWRTRVFKRSFVLGTVLLPIASIGFMVGAVMLTESSVVRNVVLIEDAPGLITALDVSSGQYVPRCPGCFPERENLVYHFTREAPTDSVWKAQGHTVLVEYDESILQNHSGYLVYEKSPGGTAKRHIERDLSRAMEHARVRQSTELDWSAYQRLKMELTLFDRGIEDGQRVQGGGDEVRGSIGFLFSAVLLIVLFVYGGVILRSVVEEKANHVVEVLIAAVEPEDLLLGKVVGLGAVAVTQLVAWSILSSMGFVVFQSLYDSGALGVAAAVGSSDVPVDLLTVMGENGALVHLLNINWPLMVVGSIAFYIGGYLLYGSLFAAVGSSVHSEQEGQGMVFPVTMPLMFGYFAATMVIENPDLPILEWLGWFPLTSPVIMLVRMASGVALWEVVASWVLLMLTARLVLGLAGKVYRFSVLHDGSRSGWQLLLHWVRGNGQ